MQTTFVNRRKTERFHPSHTDFYVEASLSGIGTFFELRIVRFRLGTVAAFSRRKRFEIFWV